MPTPPSIKAKKADELGKHAFFTVDSALLEELGERLVSRPEVALAELIKNSYDADAKTCRVTLEVDEGRLTIADDGVGMTEDRFLSRWMKIGTRNKADERLSELYKRRYAGSKGVGRFAARFLGSDLVLTSTAFDPSRSAIATLVARFDWTASTRAGSLEQFRIPYTVNVNPQASLGTKLVISGGSEIAAVRDNIKGVANSVFELTNPLDGLEQPAFITTGKAAAKVDPGFSVALDGSDDQEVAQDKTLQAQILSRYVARARIVIKKGTAHISVEFPGKGIVFDDQVDLKQYYKDWGIDSPALVDIRYFPRRAGFFSGAEVDGRQALRWLRDHGGVALIENKFRVVPYGQQGDDWLRLDADAARNRRAWRSSVVSALFPMSPTATTVEKDNPMLYLPQNAQVVGAVFVSPQKSPSIDANSQLIQAINREGYLENSAFKSLRRVARTAIELIAHFDHKHARQEEEKEYRTAIREARGDLGRAIKEIAESRVIGAPEKKRLVEQLRTAQTRVGEAERYSDQIRQSLEQMSLLGVLSGFLTHEYEKTMFRLEGAISVIRKLAKQHPSLKNDLDGLGKSRDLLVSYLDYARLFTTAVGDDNKQPFDARAQIDLVLQTLSDFRIKHAIEINVDGSEDLEITGVPLAAYSGIVMNLVTNAFKAVVARSDKAPRRVSITASLAGSRHVLAVSDNGIGIPESLRSRIWDPLYSTTRNEMTTLGSGMGLGLTLVRRVVLNLHGKIEVLPKALPGFATTFKVDIPVSNQ